MNYPLKQSLAGLILCVSLNAYAQDNGNTENTASLSLRQAYDLTLKHNPELSAYPFYLRQGDAEKLQAGLSPQPRLGLQLDNAFGSGDRQDLDSAEITLSLSQTFELGGKQQNRLDFADARQQQTQAEYNLARLDVLAETSRRYYQLLYIKQQQQQLSAREQQERAALTIIQQRAKAGAVSDADVSNMALRLAKSRQQLQQNSAASHQARLSLSAMWLGAADFDAVSGQLNNLPQLPAEAQLRRQLEQQLDTLPGYRLQLAMQRLADQRLQLEQARGHSDLTLGFGVRQFENSGDQALSLSASMPFSFSNPNRGDIAAAEHNRALTVQQSEQQRTQLALTLRRLHQGLRHNLKLNHNIEQQLLPLAQKFLSDTEKAYQQGRYSLLQWIDAQHQIFSLQQQQIDTQLNIHLQVLELERVLGQSIASSQD